MQKNKIEEDLMSLVHDLRAVPMNVDMKHFRHKMPFCPNKGQYGIILCQDYSKAFRKTRAEKRQLADAKSAHRQFLKDKYGKDYNKRLIN